MMQPIPAEVHQAVLRCKEAIAKLAKANDARDFTIRAWLSDDAFKDKTLREFAETPEATGYLKAELEVHTAWRDLKNRTQDWGLAPLEGIALPASKIEEADSRLQTTLLNIANVAQELIGTGPYDSYIEVDLKSFRDLEKAIKEWRAAADNLITTTREAHGPPDNE